MKRIKILFCVATAAMLLAVLIGCNQPETYSLEFTVDGQMYDRVSVQEGELCVLPSTPEVVCKQFAGWFLDPEGNRAFAGNEPITQSMTLYALFSESHTYTTIITNPTCTESGYTTYTCSGCGNAYRDAYTEPTGHTYIQSRFEPTCTHVGHITYVCACGNCYTEELAATEHTYVSVVTPPTLKEGGYTTHTCSACDTSYRDAFTPPIEHEHQMVTTIAAPTCDEMGYTTYTCSLCDHTYNDNYVDALGHDYETHVFPPDETHDGYTRYTCTVCRHGYLGDFIDAHAHTYDTEVIEPTCTSRGWTVYTCTVCDHTYEGDFTTKPHDYESYVTEPTCTESGYTTYSCRDCGDTYTDNYISGSHSYESIVTAPTCTEGGYTTQLCTVCGTSYISHTTLPTPHPYSETVVPPSCWAMGYTVFTCTVCSDEYWDDFTDTVSHEIREEVTPPTCTSDGYTTYSCANCDYVNRDLFTPVIDHSMCWRYDSTYHWLACETCDTNFDPEGPYRHIDANCDCGYVAPVGTVLYTPHPDGGWWVSDYQGSYDAPIDLHIPGTYEGAPVEVSLSLLRGDVRSVTLDDGVILGDHVISDEAAQSLEELYFYCAAEGEFGLGGTNLKRMLLPRNITSLYLSDCRIDRLDLPSTVKTFRMADSHLGTVCFEGNVTDWLGLDSTVVDLLCYTDQLYIDGELVEDLVIPEGVQSLGDYLFCNIKTLRSVSLPSTLTSIGEYTFENCTALEQVDIPSSVTVIGKRAFANCSSLSDLTLHEGLEAIMCYAFENCPQLTSVILPSGITTLHNGIFYGCDQIRFVYLPDSIAYMASSNCSCSDIAGILGSQIQAVLLLQGAEGTPAYAFAGATMYLPYDGFEQDSSRSRILNTYFDASVSDYFVVGDYGFVRTGPDTADVVHYMGSGTDVTIPNTVLYADTELRVTQIRDFIFAGKTVSTLHIPKNVEIITSLLGADAIQSVTVDPENAALTVVDGVLFSKNIQTLILYPSLREGTHYHVPDSVTFIMSHAFACPAELEYVYMPDSSCLGQEAFVSKRNIVIDTPDIASVPYRSYAYGGIFISTESADAPAYVAIDGLRYLVHGDKAAVISYRGTDAELTVPASITHGDQTYDVVGIFSGAFYRCNTLERVTLSDGIRVVGNTILNGYYPEDYAFDCSFYWDDRWADVTNRHAFTECDALEALLLPDSVTHIMGLAEDCDALTNVDLGDRLVYINHGIGDCDGLTSIVFPPSLQTMELYSLNNCTGLKTLTIGTVGMTEKNETPSMTIYTWAIYNCNSITTMTIGDQVGKIEWRLPSSVQVLYAGTGFYFSPQGTVEKLQGRFEEIHFGGSLADFIDMSEWYCESQHLYLGGKLLEGDLVLDSQLATALSQRLHRNQDITRLILEGDNVTIKGYQFYYCPNLTEVVAQGHGAVLGYYACPSVTSLVIEGSIARLEQSPFGKLNTVRVADVECLFHIEYSPTEANCLFNENTDLYMIGQDLPCYEIVVPESVTVIKTNALAGLDFNRYTVVLHDQVTKIEKWALAPQSTCYYTPAVKGVESGDWYYAYEDDPSTAVLYDDPYTTVSEAMLQYDCYWYKL